jgi:hypothetical protein
VSIYLVSVHHDTHTCPADPQPHPFATTRTVLGVIDGGPCRTPVTFHLAGQTFTVACGRHEPPDRQCGACRTIITEQSVTSTDHGRTRPAATRVPGGLAAHLCTICRWPLAAALADLGHHITCQPPRVAA